MGVIIEILSALKEAGVAGPGDLVSRTGRPRYLVLSTFKLLEELGLVEAVYSKGTHRVYRISILGERLLEASVEGLPEIIEAGLKSLEARYSTVPIAAHDSEPVEAA